MKTKLRDLVPCAPNRPQPHILQDCPLFTAQRNQRPGQRDADLNTKLWGSATNLELTTSFVTTTELRIEMAIVER